MSSAPPDFSYMYDVFLNFRGDTRYGFTKHLHEALVQNNVKAFMDVVNLDKGEELGEALLSAIEGSKIAIVIFSKEYASSTWCLGELVKIMDCKNYIGMKVIPVFFNIDPAIVRKQTGPYGEAIEAHLRKFQNDVQKVRRWCSALTEAASIVGWDAKDKYEPDVIKSIVEDVSRKLKGQSLEESRSLSQSTSRSLVNDYVQFEKEVSDDDDDDDDEDIIPLHRFDLAAALGGFSLGATSAESSSTVSNSRKRGIYENNVTKKWNDIVAKTAASSTSFEGTEELVFFNDSSKYMGLKNSVTRILDMLHGEEKFGTVYTVELNNGIEVAVTRLKSVTLMSKQKFKSKMEAMGGLRHENLVPLRGYYFSAEEKLLFYDYMPMSNLYKLLHEIEDKTWNMRLNAALEAARGIEYIHSQSLQMTHGNIKSSNILFAESLVARVSGYCLADLVDPYSTLSSTAIDGYRAPEVTNPYEVSQETDVYSFGVLLIELVSGKNPQDAFWSKEKASLPRWLASIDQREWIYRVIDVEMVWDEKSVIEMFCVLQLALECTALLPHQRPTMSEVTERIEELRGASTSSSNHDLTVNEEIEHVEELRHSGSNRSNIELVD